jgi:hypothetical protein
VSTVAFTASRYGVGFSAGAGVAGYLVARECAIETLCRIRQIKNRQSQGFQNGSGIGLPSPFQEYHTKC